MSTYAERLRFARDRRHMTQAQLARAAGVTRETVTRIETGVIEKPHNDTAIRLARALRVDLRWFCGRACPMADDLWFVYWFMDEAHSVIYVGMSGNPIGRFAQHRYQPWAAEIHDYAWKVYPTYEAAAEAEKIAIRALDPRHNRRHRGPQRLERTKLVR